MLKVEKGNYLAVLFKIDREKAQSGLVWPSHAINIFRKKEGEDNLSNSNIEQSRIRASNVNESVANRESHADERRSAEYKREAEETRRPEENKAEHHSQAEERQANHEGGNKPENHHGE